MAKWKYIPGRWWIFALPNIVFLAVGIILLVNYFSGLRVPEGSTWFPIDEILFLGILCIVFPPISTLALALRIKRHNKEEDLILKNSICCKGKILSVHETGLEINDSPQIEMLLLVELKDGTEKEIEHTCFISLLDLAHLSVGSIVPVFVDSKESDKCVVNTSLLTH